MQDNHSSSLLGDVHISLPQLKGVEDALDLLSKLEISHPLKKQNHISKQLYNLIKQDDSKGFLLPAVISFIEQLHLRNIFLTYTFSTFEFWLNQYSGLNIEEQLHIRGKIVGKYIPRSDYQIAFPIGSGKVFPGSHFVTAHGSPDVDTIIATFWGWMDAFSARVSSGFHVWNVPDGPPSAQVEIDLLFYQIFGKNTFPILAKYRNSLSINSLDLLTQQGFIQKYPHEFTFDIDHERSKTAVVVVNNDGTYLGDWRHIDVEGVRQVINTFNMCLRWIESDLNLHLIALFAEKNVTLDKIKEKVSLILNKKLIETEPAKEFTFRQQKNLQIFLQEVINIPSGLETAFSHFLAILQDNDIINSQPFFAALDKLQSSAFFDDKQQLIENRPQIFAALKQVVTKLSEVFIYLRNFIDTLDVSMQIKEKVFLNKPSLLSHRSDIDEVKAKMGSYPYLTVNLSARSGDLYPLGVIYASDLYQEKLGTVTLRDFCNREETKVPSYLEVISVIDHHKTSLQTQTPPQAIIADTQSSNVLVAKLAFQMHDKYSSGNQTLEQVEEQIKQLSQENWSPKISRLLQRLFKRKEALFSESLFYVSPDREFIEYSHYLYAIFDDTDLLTKMTPIDVQVVAEILNRLKSLQMKQEVEIISFDDIPYDQNFVKTACKRLLQNKDLYSLYAKVYEKREKIVALEFEKCANGEKSAVFSDTKTQNQCARVGQTKLFENNVALFQKLSPDLQKIWVEQAKKFHAQQSQVDLFMHMVSTIAGAQNLYEGKTAEYNHKDELWLYIPAQESAVQHLKLFLTDFQHCPVLDPKEMELEFLGDNAEDFKEIFSESFLSVPITINKEKNIPIAIIRYKAGTLNSRKSMISPYLPKK